MCMQKNLIVPVNSDRCLIVEVDSLNNSKVVDDGFLTVKKLLLTSVIFTNTSNLNYLTFFKIVTRTTSYNWWVCFIVMSVIVASFNDVKLSTTLVAF